LIARLGAEKPEAILGVDDRIDLVIEWVGPGAEQAQLGRVAVSVGQIVAIERISPTTVLATYLPPATAFPQVALALFEWLPPAGPPRHLLWRCPLRARTNFPIRTSSGATVTVTIGADTFGPVRADREGRVILPLDVPPGIPGGIARAIDRYGNTRETAVELSPPPFAKSVSLAAESVEPGSDITAFVAAVDGAGQPVNPATVALLAPGERLEPTISEPGIARFTLRAPTNVQEGPIDLHVLLPNGSDESGPVVALRAGPPWSLHVVPDHVRLTVGQSTFASVAIFTRDAFGNLAGLQGLSVSVDGVPTTPIVDGRVATLIVTSPPHIGRHDRIVVEGELGELHAFSRILLQGERPEHLSITAERDRLSQEAPGVRIFVRTTDRFGAPAPARALSIKARAKGGHFSPWTALNDSAWSATFVADPVDRPATTHLVIGVSPELTAHLRLPVDPRPERGEVALRTGVISNFGASFAPFVAAEWNAAILRQDAEWRMGVEAYFLAFRFNDGPMTPLLASSTSADLFQLPVMFRVSRRVPLAGALELRVAGAAGLELAVLRTKSEGPLYGEVEGKTLAPVAEGSGELGYFLAGGEALLGVRYLLARVGSVSSGDRVDGNSLGLAVDAGYRLRW